MPPVEDRAAWLVPAEADEVEECAAFLVTAIQPSLADNPARLRTLVGLIAMQDYTRAELLLAMKRLPFVNSYGEGFRLSDLGTLIDDNRNARRIVADPADGKPRMLTERQMFDACDKHPELFRREDFGICDYDSMDRPFFRYARAAGPHKHAPQPQLPEATAPRREGVTGTFQVSTLVTPPSGDGQASGTPEVQP